MSESRAVHTNRMVLTACALALAAFVAVLALISDGTTRSVVGLVGVALVTAGLGLIALDAWVHFPRPAPEVVPGGTRLRGAISGPVSMVVAATGVALIALSFLLAPSLEDVSEGRRGGGWVYVVVVAAPVLLAAAVALLVRRDHLLLTPEAVVVRRVGRTRAVRWDEVRRVEPVPGDPGEGLRITGVDGSWALVPTRQLAPSLEELTAIVRHLAATPADRARLATPEAPAMLADLRRGVVQP